MKNLYKTKIGFSKKILKGVLILTTLFIGLNVTAQQTTYGLYTPGFLPEAYIQTLSISTPDSKGIAFLDNLAEPMMTVSTTGINMKKALLLEQGILFSVNPGYIAGLGQISGTQNGLKIRGNTDFFGASRTDFQITSSGLIGIGNGITTPNGALHILGADNNGSTAALTIESPTQRMLIDGNEIDANTGLYLQANSDTNIRMAEGGGNVGVGLMPLEKLHITGNLRLDNGLFITNKEMIFRPSVGDVGDINTNNIIFQNNAEIEIMRINNDGNVGIGTSTPSQKLEVEGTVKAASFVSSASSFPDYVFEADYNLLSLNQLHSFIKENKHLPNMPSEKEVVKNGLDVSDVLVKSVENIENIYLHLIQLNEKMETLEKENAELKALLNK